MAFSRFTFLASFKTYMNIFKIIILIFATLPVFAQSISVDLSIGSTLNYSNHTISGNVSNFQPKESSFSIPAGVKLKFLNKKNIINLETGFIFNQISSYWYTNSMQFGELDNSYVEWWFKTNSYTFPLTINVSPFRNKPILAIKLGGAIGINSENKSISHQFTDVYNPDLNRIGLTSSYDDDFKTHLKASVLGGVQFYPFSRQTNFLQQFSFEFIFEKEFIKNNEFQLFYAESRNGISNSYSLMGNRKNASLTFNIRYNLKYFKKKEKLKDILTP